MYTRRFWVDTETTGLNARKSFAFQAAYLIEENGKVLLERTLEMRPDDCAGFVFEAGAEEVHGWPADRIRALPPESTVFPRLMADLKAYAPGKLTVVGFNVEFDIRFLREIFYRNKPAGAKYSDYYKYFERMPFDVLQFAQGTRVAGLLDLPKLGLSSLCEHFGFDTSAAHSALADVRNTKKVFEALVALMGALHGAP